MNYISFYRLSLFDGYANQKFHSFGEYFQRAQEKRKMKCQRTKLLQIWMQETEEWYSVFEHIRSRCLTVH
jgi:hypothetical protein